MSSTAVVKPGELYYELLTEKYLIVIEVCLSQFVGLLQVFMLDDLGVVVAMYIIVNMGFSIDRVKLIQENFPAVSTTERIVMKFLSSTVSTKVTSVVIGDIISTANITMYLCVKVVRNSKYTTLTLLCSEGSIIHPTYCNDDSVRILPRN